ncbi:MAG TPA: EamA family transporter [Longimicrobium sp.]|nr:EamA family transporter [Longimicrobium sp.]
MRVIARRVRAMGARRLAAYAATWIIWGSTYLAIRVAVASVPPFLLAGVRSVVAGSILVGIAALRHDPRPRRGQVTAAVLTGAMFFLVGHGGLFWAEQRVASGPAALMIATEHFWLLLAGWMLGRVVATRRAWTGVAVGLSGVTLLTLGGSRGGVDPAGAAVLLVASLAWSLGTLYFTGDRKPASQPYASGIPLLGGGVLLLIASALSGEPGRVSIADVPLKAVLALAYLIVFGSVVAFTAYSWLVEREGPARALSFTYVNPLVAVLLGSLLLHEPLTWRIGLAAAAIVAAVVLIIGGTAAPAKPGPGPETEPPPDAARAARRPSAAHRLSASPARSR